MCILVAVWGVYGFGGPTLIEVLERSVGFSLMGSSAFVSALVAVFGAVSLIPAMRRASAGGEHK